MATLERVCCPYYHFVVCYCFIFRGPGPSDMAGRDTLNEKSTPLRPGQGHQAYVESELLRRTGRSPMLRKITYFERYHGSSPLWRLALQRTCPRVFGHFGVQFDSLRAGPSTYRRTSTSVRRKKLFFSFWGGG